MPDALRVFSAAPAPFSMRAYGPAADVPLGPEQRSAGSLPRPEVSAMLLNVSSSMPYRFVGAADAFAPGAVPEPAALVKNVVIVNVPVTEVPAALRHFPPL